MLILVILTSSALIFARFRLEPSAFFSYGQFFLLGAGFLLLETRGILATSALFGSTWVVNSLVIGIVLLMALGANLVVTKFQKIQITHAYLGITLALLVLYFFPLSHFLSESLPIKSVIAFVIVGMPFFFAGIVFSRLFSSVTEPQKALGVNILGALFGGCLEYFSVVIGLNNLALLSLAIYLASAGLGIPARQEGNPQRFNDYLRRRSEIWSSCEQP